MAFTFNFVTPVQIRHAALATMAVILTYDGLVIAPSRLHGEMLPFAIFVTAISIFSLTTRWRLENAERQEFKSREALVAANRRLQTLTEKLAAQANTDPLTGIANRRRLQQLLDETWAEAITRGHWIGIALADIDHFKTLNDACGHEDGDLCLQRVADRLQAIVTRKGGHLARYGGEEFVAIVLFADPDAIVTLGEELRSGIEALHIPNPGLAENAHMTISVGASSMIPTETTKPTILLRAADRALYEAKHRGRNTVVGLAAVSHAEDLMTADLRRA
ncbi:GGDEF domain-containing protein [Consotaella aegiceratis]|uniref:GGDEF domain-containing protein n=1 Tax=Consotaella aegiceratis TaxID=3097961 RepID=UPI002F400744